MKNTIGKKILIVIFVPFLIIFGALSSYIAYTITTYVRDWMELEIKGISEINATDLAGRMHSVEISVNSAADSLELLDPQSENARQQADGIVKAMFNNRYIYNSWLAYEPDAFDGRDKEYPSDYPGAPSGRFIRSYIQEDGRVVVAPDMDEQTLDDSGESPWYVIPRDSDRLYIDVANEIPNLYDYGVGDDPVYTLSIVAPVHKDGRVIGCVGADVLFDNMTIGIGGGRQAAVAVFYPNGRIFYSEDLKFAEENVNTLQFTEPERIMDAVSKGTSLFLPDEYSMFLNARAFTYFQPINIADEEDGALSLYVAIPRTESFSALRPVFILIALISAAVFMVVTAMYLYISKRISKPIRNLTLAADAISQGDLNTEIASFDSKDEIGLISRSLHRMVEQFRVYIIQLRQAQEEMTIHTLVGDCIKESDSVPKVFGNLLAMLCGHMGFHMASAVCVRAGKATVSARFDAGSNVRKTDNSQDFMYHSQIQSLLDRKKLLFFNSFAISDYKLEFLGDMTLSVCILPLWNDDILCGYLILENKDKNLSFGGGKESLLIDIAKMLAEWLSQSDGGEADDASGTEMFDADIKPIESLTSGDNAATEEAAHTPSEHPLSHLRSVDGLDVDAALEAMGGLTDILERSVELFAKLLPETADRLDKSIAGDLNAFAIEIHGLKGSLNNIGALALGSEASTIEKAAKSADLKLADELYRPFRERLLRFHQALKSVLDMESDVARATGDKTALVETLEKAALSTKSSDAFDALDLIQPLMDFTYGEEVDAKLAKIAEVLEMFDCEKAHTIMDELIGGLQS